MNEVDVFYHATGERVNEADMTDRKRLTQWPIMINTEAYVSKLQHFVSLSV